MKLQIDLNNIDDLYNEADNFDEKQGRKDIYDTIKDEAEYSRYFHKNFFGLPLQEILNSKYSYTKNLDDIKDLEEDLEPPSNSKFKHVWNDLDGDEMSMERALEQQPFLKKKLRTDGNSSGRFVTLHINIGENCGVNYKDMLNKTNTAISIIDYLESRQYRVKVLVESLTLHIGKYKNQHVKETMLTVPIKEYEEPVVKSLLATVLSPWFFRYWILRLYAAKLYTTDGIGHGGNLKYNDDKTNIYINSGECLTEKSSKQKILDVIKLFEEDTEEY